MTADEGKISRATNKAAVEQAMLTWEQEHPDRCDVVEDQDASNLFGFGSVGKAKLSDRFPFVFVPGIRDAASEAVEKKGSLLTRLLTAVADQRAVCDARGDFGDLCGQLIRRNHAIDEAQPVGFRRVNDVAQEKQFFGFGRADAARQQPRRAEIAAEAKVETLVFTHMVPPLNPPVTEQMFLRGVADVFKGKVLLAKDGLRFDLPTRN